MIPTPESCSIATGFGLARAQVAPAKAFPLR